MSILYFGDVDESLARWAKERSPDAVLIDHNNCHTMIEAEQLPPVCYTALGDLPKSMKIVYRLLDLAETIVYSPPLDGWSDGKIVDTCDPTASVRGLSDMIMLDFHKLKNNVSLPSERVWFDHRNWYIDRLQDQRQHNGQQLWMAGCSFTWGSGVDPAQRYGQLVADRLGLPVSWLAHPGSSIEWSADQILRSDIRSGDLVIWGLTSVGRMACWNNQFSQLVHITIQNLRTQERDPGISDSALMEILVSDTMLYKSIISVKQVVNYCTKVNARLSIIGLLTSDALNLQLSYLPEFEPVLYLKHRPEYLDIGTDNHHPGPLQHQFYADFCIKHMQDRGYI